MRYDKAVMPRRRNTPKKTVATEAQRYEIELIPGLERSVDDELATTLGRRAYRLTGYPREGRMSIRYAGPVERLMGLLTPVAAHLVLRFDVPRPKALLGHQHFTRLMDVIKEVLALHPTGTFTTFRVSAAGTESATMRRLRGEIAAATRLDEQVDEAHLNLAIRRSSSGDGWEVLVRLSPMPLSARTWRVCNRPDALNATIAHAMVTLPGHSGDDRFLNLGCGSGTLLAERAAAGPFASAVGLDIDQEAIACAQENLSASNTLHRIELLRGDINSPPLPDRSFDAAVADLPFGMLANTDVGLDNLYEAALREAARLVVEDGAFTVITARRKLFEDTLDRHAESWRRAAEVPLRVSFHRGYIAPSIYLLRRV